MLYKTDEYWSFNFFFNYQKYLKNCTDGEHTIYVYENIWFWWSNNDVKKTVHCWLHYESRAFIYYEVECYNQGMCEKLFFKSNKLPSRKSNVIVICYRFFKITRYHYSYRYNLQLPLLEKVLYVTVTITWETFCYFFVTFLKLTTITTDEYLGAF